MPKTFKAAIAYLRTSSAANVGADKDSDKRQRAAIQAFAKSAGFTIVGEYYDRAVSGADRIDASRLSRNAATSGIERCKDDHRGVA